MNRTYSVISSVLLAAALTLATLTSALAVRPDEVLSDAAMEKRAREISAGLRCMVCQNQSIDDSDAPLARDLRLLVRDRLTAGDSDEAVKNFLVARYGAFVLLKPPFEMQTLILWGGPFAVLAAGVGAIVFAARRRNRLARAEPALSEDERKRLAEIVGEDR